MNMIPHFSICFIILIGTFFSTLAQDTVYDSSAPTECKAVPDEPLYGGGLLKGQKASYQWVRNDYGLRIHAPTYNLPNLVPGVYYTFSSWVRVKGIDSAVVWANLGTTMKNCEATVLAKRSCWTFLKGGIYLIQPLNVSTLYFEAFIGYNIPIEVANASLQPFTEEQWRANQQANINRERKRDTRIIVTDKKDNPLKGATIKVNQITSDFPFGVAISNMIIGNTRYQEWFKKRFTATVFENELKWPDNEPRPGVLDYTVSDQMVDFVTKNGIKTRGHNVLWQDSRFAPSWSRNLTRPQLQEAVNRRIDSVVGRYKNKFIHWDVNNEMMHYDYYEKYLGNQNASLEFYKRVQELDPEPTLFINDFKLVEECGNTTNVDAFVSKVNEFKSKGIKKVGIGLEGHFAVPNPVYMRATIDKLATLNVPIWLTEVDISLNIPKEQQAIYLEMVLREGFSHPSVNGIIIWGGISTNGCWNMCLTDLEFKNTPAGDVVDKLLKEWHTGELKGLTNDKGLFGFSGFLGEYNVTIEYNSQVVTSTLSLSKGVDPQNVTIQL